MKKQSRKHEDAPTLKNPAMLEHPAADPHGLSFMGTESRTKQSFAEQVNINSIMARWERSGELPPPNSRLPLYGDFSNVTDYLTASQLVIEANEAFMQLDPAIRAEFDNDPAKLIDFVESHPQEAQEMGLILSGEMGTRDQAEAGRREIAPSSPTTPAESGDGTLSPPPEAKAAEGGAS
ncbi:internal scaffolding protein [Microviridae sp.]|nr:internal scaffolding protein [Microviridae sp.]